jgi:hypothetical protein
MKGNHKTTTRLGDLWVFPNGFVFFAVLLLLLNSCRLVADNGAFVFAKSLESIIVDGDFSDWPDDIPRQEVRSLRLGRDLSGSTAVVIGRKAVVVQILGLGVIN